MALTGALPSWQTRSLPKANTAGSQSKSYDPAGQSTFTNKLINGFGTNSSPNLSSASSTSQSYGSGWNIPSTVTNQIASSWGSGYLSPYAGDYANIVGQMGVISSQIPYIWQNQSLSGSQMQSQAAIDRDRIALRQQLLGIDGSNLGYDNGYFNRLKQLLGAERGIAGQQHELRLEQLNADANNKMRDHKSNYVASGSIFAPQTTREYANIYANLDRDRKAQTYNFQREGIGFDRQEAGLDRDLFRNKNEQEKLGIAGKMLNLDSKELESKLKFGLQQLGLDADKALTQLLGQLDTLGDQGIIILQKIMDSIPPEMWAGMSQLGGYAPYKG